jgi:hypothetical protein
MPPRPSFLLVAVLALAAASSATAWTEGEVMLGQAQAFNDDLAETKETVLEGLNEATAALGTALGVKGDALRAVINMTSMGTNDAVITALDGQSALGGIAQTFLNTKNMLQRRAAASAGLAAQQMQEQPAGVLGAFGEGRAAGSGLLTGSALQPGVAYSRHPTAHPVRPIKDAVEAVNGLLVREFMYMASKVKDPSDRDLRGDLHGLDGRPSPLLPPGDEAPLSFHDAAANLACELSWALRGPDGASSDGASTIPVPALAAAAEALGVPAPAASSGWAGRAQAVADAALAALAALRADGVPGVPPPSSFMTPKDSSPSPACSPRS